MTASRFVPSIDAIGDSPVLVFTERDLLDCLDGLGDDHHGMTDPGVLLRYVTSEWFRYEIFARHFTDVEDHEAFWLSTLYVVPEAAGDMLVLPLRFGDDPKWVAVVLAVDVSNFPTGYFANAFPVQVKDK